MRPFCANSTTAERCSGLQLRVPSSQRLMTRVSMFIYIGRVDANIEKTQWQASARRVTSLTRCVTRDKSRRPREDAWQPTEMLLVCRGWQLPRESQCIQLLAAKVVRGG